MEVEKRLVTLAAVARASVRQATRCSSLYWEPIRPVRGRQPRCVAWATMCVRAENCATPLAQKRLAMPVRSFLAPGRTSEDINGRTGRWYSTGQEWSERPVDAAAVSPRAPVYGSRQWDVLVGGGAPAVAGPP